MSEDYIYFIINRYKIIDEQEKRALRLYYYWIINRKKIFPDIFHSKFDKSKDPRNFTIFKYCYKVQRETRNKLEEKDYENYIRAQLIILKSLSKKYNTPINVDINCIAGEKAWKRWKLYRFKLIQSKNDSVNNFISYPNINNLEFEFNRTNEFLVQNLGKINKENIEKNKQNIIFWFFQRKINPYFLVFNVYINEVFVGEDFMKLFKIDVILYKQRTNDKIKELYRKVFKQEVFEAKNDPDSN